MDLHKDNKPLYMLPFQNPTESSRYGRLALAGSGSVGVGNRHLVLFAVVRHGLHARLFVQSRATRNLGSLFVKTHEHARLFEEEAVDFLERATGCLDVED